MTEYNILKSCEDIDPSSFEKYAVTGISWDGEWEMLLTGFYF